LHTKYTKNPEKISICDGRTNDRQIDRVGFNVPLNRL